MKISVSVMAHEKRAHFFEYLKSKLGDVPFSVDKDGPENIGIWENCKRAWRMHDPNAEYHIVVQDDMILGRDFLKRAEALMTQDYIYNFYMSKRPKYKNIVEHAMRTKKGFIILPNLCHEACWGMRVSRIEDMIKFCDALGATNDRQINTYIRSHKLPVYFPIPSYASHRAEPSLHELNRGKYPPGARYFIGE